MQLSCCVGLKGLLGVSFRNGNEERAMGLCMGGKYRVHRQGMSSDEHTLAVIPEKPGPSEQP